MKIILIFLFSLCSLVAEEKLFKALPLTNPVDLQKSELGKLLFNDPILSKDGSVSCATCHPLLNYGVDGLKKSFGIDGKIGKRNAPTVWNALYNSSQFWDGRAKTLEEQALEPIVNPVEMGENLSDVVEKLKNSKQYFKQFKALYDDGVTVKNLANAIAEFERTLISPRSKFDKYLQGNYTALNDQEKAGLGLFKSKGCVACHNGINVGGTLFQKIGIFGALQTDGEEDLGRYNVTKNIFDKYYFKVPSLRNVEMTAPYFHNGSVATLKEAVEIMAKLQLGRELKDAEIESIVSFLKTLTGEVHE